ncbi:MAG: 3-deoxy-7-phosphoheptulonate synthase, partial [Candidatus Taylorbacteria bacterium]|nr:3-deoxy-7-phosphoheptulonate synthase [Candidatus Taylorbacteria bacterium]
MARSIAMIVEMSKGCEVIEIQAVVAKINQLGFESLVNKGKERVVVAVLGAGVGSVDTGQFEALAGVEQVVRMTKPYKLSSRDFKPTNTVVMSGNLAIGGKEIVVMAGPCSVETEQQILSCAVAAKEAGAKVLRGGAYKPRTSPFAFQGLKEAGLKLLSKARKETGLQVVTEVVRP